MDWSSHPPPCWLPPSSSWRSGGKRDDCVEVWGVTCLQCEPTQRWRREDGDVRAAGVGGRHKGGMGGWALRALKAASPIALPCAPPPRSWLDLNRSASLAGLNTQLLPVGRLLCLRLGARVGASVERRHGAAFGIGVQAAVGWGVAGLELGGALHLLQSTDCMDRTRNMNGGRGLEDKQQDFELILSVRLETCHRKCG